MCTSFDFNKHHILLKETEALLHTIDHIKLTNARYLLLHQSSVNPYLYKQKFDCTIIFAVVGQPFLTPGISKLSASSETDIFVHERVLVVPLELEYALRCFYS